MLTLFVEMLNLFLSFLIVAIAIAAVILGLAKTTILYRNKYTNSSNNNEN